mmetsp:Transcript_27336/g.38837  ORF Transcript_27336/g.38837 Transcript_27336/m.38837 type:complete len:125 (-) Transcript_27336:276-650(-)
MNTAVVASIAYLRILSRGWLTSRSPIPPLTLTLQLSMVLRMVEQKMVTGSSLLGSAELAQECVGIEEGLAGKSELYTNTLQIPSQLSKSPRHVFQSSKVFPVFIHFPSLSLPDNKLSAAPPTVL